MVVVVVVVVVVVTAAAVVAAAAAVVAAVVVAAAAAAAAEGESGGVGASCTSALHPMGRRGGYGVVEVQCERAPRCAIYFIYLIY